MFRLAIPFTISKKTRTQSITSFIKNTTIFSLTSTKKFKLYSWQKKMLRKLELSRSTSKKNHIILAPRQSRKNNIKLFVCTLVCNS